MVDAVTSKPDAYRFLSRLEAHLNATTPPAEVVRAKLADTVARAKAAARRTADRRSSFAEGAFLTSELRFSSDDARRALLSESYRAHSKFASASPVRPGAHPFRKVIGASAREVIEIWRGRSGVNPLARNSCPDLALRAPSPYRTVFEAKYHTNPSATSAEAELAKNIYQAFFYLALPRLPATTKHSAWDYEFACVLAYDATPDGSLLQAWKSLRDSVKAACWSGANVYVMILRGSSDAASV